jgi:FO synthase subunit 1
LKALLPLMGEARSSVREGFLEALHRSLEEPANYEDALTLSTARGSEVLLLLSAALAVKRRTSGDLITYSRKVFTPLTNLCRNRCTYCGFRRELGEAGAGFMGLEEAMKLVKLGERLGAKEVLVSTGERPEEAYGEARAMLKSLGYSSTVEYVRVFEERVLEEAANMMPHTNIGVLSKSEMAELKPLNASMGLMLEVASERLMGRGMPHERSPSKHPEARLRMIREAGELRIPFTTGVLIGIGETWEERIRSLMEIRRLHEEHGHIQEVIVQGFRPEPGTPMEGLKPPTPMEVAKTVALARLIFHGEVSVQAPPNLSPEALDLLLLSGLQDWGGVSPLTPDYVNPRYPWPKIPELKAATEAQGFKLRERLPIYPRYVRLGGSFIPEPLKERIYRLTDEEGLVKEELQGGP